MIINISWKDGDVILCWFQFRNMKFNFILICCRLVGIQPYTWTLIWLSRLDIGSGSCHWSVNIVNTKEIVAGQGTNNQKDNSTEPGQSNEIDNDWYCAQDCIQQRGTDSRQQVGSGFVLLDGIHNQAIHSNSYQGPDHVPNNCTKTTSKECSNEGQTPQQCQYNRTVHYTSFQIKAAKSAELR